MVLVLDFWAYEKVVFEVYYAVLRPLSSGSKYPQGPHMSLYPSFHVLPRQPTKDQIYFANLVHFFFVFSLFKFFWARFLANYDPPLCLYVR